MLNHLYNWLFRESLANQVKNLQFDKSDLVELDTELDFEKLQQVQTVTKPFMVTGGYLNKSEGWKLVFTLPSIYHHNQDILRKYLLTNFKISHLNYRTLKLTIDDQTIIDDTLHPWKDLWKEKLHSENDSSIPYLTFPIQEINYQTIRFELTFDKSEIEDPKDVTISFDICLFNNKKDETDFFNAWAIRKYSFIVPKTQFNLNLYSKNPKNWLLASDHLYHEIVLVTQNNLEEFPLQTIKLTDHQNQEHLLNLDYEQEDNYYRMILTTNNRDGLSGRDWKSIEIIPKAHLKDKIDQINLLCSGQIQFKNYKLLELGK